MSNKTIQHKRSSTAGNQPDNTQVEVGEIAINLADRAIYTKDGSNVVTALAKDIWKSDTKPDSAQEGDLWYDTTTGKLSVIDSTGESRDVSTPASENVSASNTTTSGGFSGGSGTEADPYTLSSVSTNNGQTDVYLGTISITGLDSNQVVLIQDMNQSTNGTRFSANNGQHHAMADASGNLDVNIVFNDIPETTTSTTYTGKLKIGSNTVYVAPEVDLTIAQPLEGGSTLTGPSDTSVGSNTWDGSDGTTLSASGDLLLSTDGTNFSSSVTVNNGDTYYVKWAGDPGSGTGIDGAHGTTITGTVSDGKGGSATVTLTIDKETTFSFQTSVDSDEALSSLTSSQEITISDINSYVYPFGSTTGDSATYSKNSGTFLDIPASNTGSSTHYLVNNDKLVVRHRNDADSNNSPSTLTLTMAGDSADFTSVTVDIVPAVAQPSIAAPANDGDTGISTTGAYSSSAFAMAEGTDTHTASSWQVVSSAWVEQPNLASAANTPSMYGIVWTGSEFCAVGDVARCATSPDGVTWTKRNNLFNAVGNILMYAIAWDGNQFCAVGASGKCATSPDGAAWTLQSGFPAGMGSSNAYSIAWDGSQFCVVGASGKCATSPDGVTWTTQSSLASAVSSNNMDGIAWDGNQFCAVGKNGKCATSPDGVTWTLQSSLASAVSSTYMESIIWNGSQFCAVGRSGKCATSPDGVTWTNQSGLTSVVGAIAVKEIAWDGSQFCVVGSNAVCATSPDGVIWTNQSGLTSAVSGNHMLAIAWDGSQFCAVGEVGSCATLSDTVEASLDSDTSALESWTLSADSALDHESDFKIRVRHHTATLSSSWSDYRTFTTQGLPGTSWTGTTNLQSAIGSVDANAAAWNGSIYVVACQSAKAATSSDGLNWTNQSDFTTAMGGANTCFDMIWTGSNFVGVATGDVALVSPDGVNWTAYSMPFSCRALARDTTTGEIVAVATSGKGCLSTNDGQSWTTQASIESASGATGLYAITWTGDRFVAVGNSGVSCYSAVGNNGLWTAGGTTKSGTLMLGIACDTDFGTDGRVCCVGASGSTSTSDDYGQTWTEQSGLSSIGASVNWFDVRHDGNQFVTCGSTSKLATSTDGISWDNQSSAFQAEVGTGKLPLNVAIGSNQYLVTGEESICAVSS